MGVSCFGDNLPNSPLEYFSPVSTWNQFCGELKQAPYQALCFTTSVWSCYYKEIWLFISMDDDTLQKEEHKNRWLENKWVRKKNDGY